MPEPTFSMTIDDDLPRTIRREREAQEREREARERAAAVPAIEPREAAGSLQAPAATVVDFDVSFGRLMTFFVKSVFAAVPALIVLTAMLWLFGQGLQALFPQLLKLKILIYVPS